MSYDIQQVHLHHFDSLKMAGKSKVENEGDVRQYPPGSLLQVHSYSVDTYYEFLAPGVLSVPIYVTHRQL
jgi:hypothetical protein